MQWTSSAEDMSSESIVYEAGEGLQAKDNLSGTLHSITELISDFC